MKCTAAISQKIRQPVQLLRSQDSRKASKLKLKWWPTDIRAMLWLGAVASAVIALWFWRDCHLILRQKVTSWTDTGGADCAVVLTGGPARIPEGFSLLAQHRIHKLIISGVYRHANLRAIFPQWAFYGSVNDRNVFLEQRSLTTYGNAEQSLHVVESLDCRNVMLVTSQTHMYRSLRTFRAVFPKNIPIIPRAVADDEYHSDTWGLIVETVKTMFYGLWAY